MYDVTRRSSFDAMIMWLKECEKQGLFQDQVPMLMVGNKCEDDAVLAVNTNEAQRFVRIDDVSIFS